MQTVRTVDALRSAVAAFRAAGERVALVPTMGALHAGHMALAAEARRRADRVVVSIFVNPTQFGPNEDFAAYPRREASDAKLLDDAGVDLLWAPEAAEMYPEGFSTTVSVAGISALLDGAARPGHFDGVATIVSKLFNQVRPDVAIFGEKDYQQLQIVSRMAADLDLGVEVIGLPTQRDDDGLALSSRNAYLAPEERVAARALPRALGEAAASIAKGAPVADALDMARKRLADAGFDPIDYVTLVDARTLGAIDTLDGPARLLAAAKLGRTRLIDNLAVLLASE